MQTYEIGQMDMAIGVQEDVIRLDISVDDVLGVNIPQGTAQLGDPEPDGLLGEGLP